MIIGKNLIRLDEVASTNEYAAGLLNNNNPEDGTIVYSYNQTKGKGHSGSKWESEGFKNIHLSIILKPQFLEIEQHYYLVKFLTLAVSRFVRAYIAKTYIKWPNDIYANNKKISGVLIENTIQGNSFKSSVAGVGININQGAFSEELNATSLFIETGKGYDLQECLQNLLRFLNEEYNRLLNNNQDAVDNDFNKYLFQINKWCTYKNEDLVFEGKITGVGVNGELEMLNRSNEKLIFGFKEVVFL